MKTLAPGTLCLVLWISSGCSSSHSNGVAGPSATPSLSGTILTFVSGETLKPVASASVAIASTSGAAFTRTYTTDADGRIGLGADVPQTFPLSMDIVASGFLDRTTYYRAASETQFTLWPSISPTGLDATFAQTLAYSPSGCPTAATGTSLGRRMSSSVRNVWIRFDATLSDAQAEAAHTTAGSRLTTANGGVVSYGVSADATDGVIFTAGIDPTAATCTAGPEPLRAATFLTLSIPNQEIIGGRLVYCTVDAARSVNLVLHELGHTYGLYHAQNPTDVMYCSSGRPSAFTARESLVMTLLRQRRSGNRWPDNDRFAVAPLRSGSQVETLACGE